MALFQECRKANTLQTGSTTQMVLCSIELPDESVILADGHVVALQSDGSAGAGYGLHGAYRRTGGGNVVAIGTPDKDDEHEDVVGWDATESISGTYLTIKVTGQTGTTINWGGYMTGTVYTP